jgi:hypothetical protein
MTPMHNMERLGAGIANGALTVLIRLYPAIREADEAQRGRGHEYFLTGFPGRTSLPQQAGALRLLESPILLKPE